MHNEKDTQQRKQGLFKGNWKLIILLCFLSWVGYGIYDGIEMRSSLESKQKKVVVATVIDAYYYWANTGVQHLHTHKYRFYVDGKEYEGVCPTTGYNIGDTLSIEYVVGHPSYNISYPSAYDK